jgi:serine/threonine protein kinase
VSGGESWRSVENAFIAALDLAGTEQAAYLQSLPPEVRVQVEALLQGHADAERELPVIESLPEPSPGERIGAYRITKLIGRGGMGCVFEAERSEGDFTQQVAIKVLSVQIAGTEARSRFRMERQILALLDHPNIVRILDGGVTPAGAPYFAMELVRGGLPITNYGADRPVSQRLELLRDVCGAIGYAHRHSVIHRDLKPANLLVTPDGVVKVLDFGIAKVLNPLPGGREENITTHMAPMTPGYASPEHLRGEDVTTSSDIYSLGLVIREVLTGSRKGDASTGRRDLDSIILKATSPEPHDRYASAAELAGDISSFLAGEPVRARQATIAYLLQRSLLKHWKLAAAGFTIVLAVSVTFWLQSRRVAHEKQKRYEQVRAVSKTMLDDMQKRIGNLPGSLDVRKSLTAQALGYLESLRADAKGDSALEIDLARAYLQMAALQGSFNDSNLGDLDGARASREKARELCESVLSRETSNVEALTSLAAYYAAKSTDLNYTGSKDLAVAAAERSVQIRREILAMHPDNQQYLADVAGALQFVANAHRDVSMRQALYRESLAIIEKLLESKPDSRTLLRNAALACKYLASELSAALKIEEAHEFALRALDLDRRLLKGDPKDRLGRLDVSFDLSTLSTNAARMGKFRESEEFARQCLKIRQDLVDEDPKDARSRDRLAYAHSLLAYALNLQGRHKEALAEVSTAFAVNADLVREHPSQAKTSIQAVAWFYLVKSYALPDNGARCTALREAVTRYRSLPGVTSRESREAEENFGKLHCGAR